MKKYEDIINLPHYNPKFHKRMSKINRAAQFAPFKALTGFDEALFWISKPKYAKKELHEDLKCILDAKIKLLQKSPSEKLVTIIYFQSLSETKGQYLKTISTIKKIDPFNKIIKLSNNVNISFDNIIDIIIN